MHGALTPGDVGRLLGTKWKEMSEDEKKPYIDMANRDKERAEAEKAAYAVRVHTVYPQCLSLIHI